MGIDMTEQEAKKYLECIVFEDFSPRTQKAILVAIQGLEEIQQYRALGTVEELRKMREKQVPKKPVAYKETNRADCPACGATVRGITKPFGDWCSKCGQKLDWGGEDAE